MREGGAEQAREGPNRKKKRQKREEVGSNSENLGPNSKKRDKQEECGASREKIGGGLGPNSEN
jgi:hypothetical protein